MTEGKQREFSRLRSFIWPVHGHELKKLLPMLAVAFFIAFAYNILRGMKDTLIVTASDCGAEVIPFLKVWAMLPMALLLTSVYVKLCHRYSTTKVFYLMMGGFLVFFALFTFVAYPLQDVLHPHGLCDWLDAHLPASFAGAVAMIRYWTFSLFYGMCELWGVVCLSLLFWGFANEVTRVCEAKRFYGLFGLGANTSAMAAGYVAVYLSNRVYNPNWIIGDNVWHQSLILLTLCVLGSGAIIMVVFHWLQRHVVDRMPNEEHRDNKQLKKLESKPSMRESFSYLLRSKYLIRVAIVVIAYNLVINLVEVLWKDQVKMLHPDANAYNGYMGYVTMLTGVIATFMAIFVSGNVIRKWGWTTAAMLTPAILIITSIGFFIFYFFPSDQLAVLTSFLGMAPLSMVALFGSAQNVLSRASKYTVFDSTKELAFIPLSRESRVKGKAAIDGVSSRLGKSGGSVIYQGLFFLFGPLSRCAPYVAGMLVLVLGGWLIAIRSLGRRFKLLTTEPEPAAATPQPDPVVDGATPGRSVAV
jgi:ATP:ADP antiporter, AAA family